MPDYVLIYNFKISKDGQLQESGRKEITFSAADDEAALSRLNTAEAHGHQEETAEPLGVYERRTDFQLLRKVERF